MKGKYRIVVKNNRVHYEFEIKRNITIVRGDSGTGKTTLINMLRQAENLGASSGIDVVCAVPCKILEGVNWKLILEHSSATREEQKGDGSCPTIVLKLEAREDASVVFEG